MSCAVSRPTGVARRDPTTATQGASGGGRDPRSHSVAGGAWRCSSRSGQAAAPLSNRVAIGSGDHARRRLAAEAERFADVALPHLGGAAQVGDGARNPKHAEEAACTQLHALAGKGQQPRGRRRCAGGVLQRGAVQRGIARAPLDARVAGRLTRARRANALPHRRRRLSGPAVEELAEPLPGNVDHQVDPIADGTAQAAGVFAESARRAAATGLVAEVTAGARVGGRDEGEVGGEVNGAARPDHDHGAFLERLAQCLEVAPREFADLIEEQHAAMSEADLSRAREPAATPDQPRPRYRMVRGAKGWPRHGGRALAQRAAQRVQRGDLNRLIAVEIREQ